ncbi:PX-associated sorting nexin 13 [Penicillium fimorum]|uniref:PX-associated sorting nexin 13 n=1 Tax=Penicillium fimorum TaxID=1882269 RepID=A0A9W9XTH1_9EURO|nr:PX-associated sorting nexin 13 [Penicillium fimorum]
MSRLNDDSQVISGKGHNTTPTRPISNQVISKELIDATLNFLSTSTNETLIGVFALLGLVTYIILGRIGLLLIGVAVGVVLHASWEGSDIVHADGASHAKNPNRRRELALEVSNRLLDWPKRAGASDIQGGGDGSVSTLEDMSSADLEYATFQPATAVALRTLTDAVVKDYVKYWYEPLLPSESTFPSSCRRILTHFITSVSSHLSRKRTEDTFLQFLTNSSSIVIVFLNELAAAFTAVGSPAGAQKAVDQYLEQFPDSSLANVLSEKQQKKKLGMIADDILLNFLDSKTYNCPAVRDFLREVFAGVVLGSTVTSLARPEFINEWIIYLLQGGESEIMHAIDAGVEGARNQGVSAPRSSEDPNANSVKAAHRESMHVARATEEEAVLEVKRLSAMIASHDTQSSGSEQPLQNEQIDEIDTLKADLASNATHENEDRHNLGAVPNMQLSASPKPSEDSSAPPLILHGAQVLVDDDGARDEKGQIKSRPMWDYLLQVEPASTRSTGWMVFRKYSEFQSLHEMLGTVSRLNQISSFSERHPILPTWKGKTRQALARDLEWYLQDAMKHESLADTDRMRRFLEKDAGSSSELTGPNKPVLSFPSQTAFENMGKGMLGALTNAPKGVAGGSKAVFEGMTGVFGGATNSKKPAVDADQVHPKADHSSRSSLSQTRSSFGDRNMIINESVDSPVVYSSDSLEIQRGEISKSPSTDSTRESIVNEQGVWTTETSPSKTSLDSSNHTAEFDVQATETIEQNSPPPRSETGHSIDQPHRQGNPITADETQIAVELIFAVINELYTLSSAWNIRRTLLNAAKSYILRPGSPTLETIRTLLQESMIEGHTSDDALGDYLVKLRENALPTEEELKTWPAPPNEEEKNRLRDTARKLFVQRGIPQALTSVMGAAASREALEKIFDSLQVESVARGFVFSILLQGLRVLTL